MNDLHETKHEVLPVWQHQVVLLFLCAAQYQHGKLSKCLLGFILTFLNFFLIHYLSGCCHQTLLLFPPATWVYYFFVFLSFFI